MPLRQTVPARPATVTLRSIWPPLALVGLLVVALAAVVTRHAYQSGRDGARAGAGGTTTSTGRGGVSVWTPLGGASLPT